MSQRTTTLISLLLAVCLMAWFICESVDSIGIPAELAALLGLPIVSAAAVFASLRSHQRRYRLIAAAIALVLVGASAFGGQQSFERAYNECVGNGESIRVSLRAYRSSHGHYPASLDEAFAERPCRRCLRGSILRYSAAADHYRLSFSDTLVSWEATDESDWFAFK